MDVQIGFIDSGEEIIDANRDREEIVNAEDVIKGEEFGLGSARKLCRME